MRRRGKHMELLHPYHPATQLSTWSAGALRHQLPGRGCLRATGGVFLSLSFNLSTPFLLGAPAPIGPLHPAQVDLSAQRSDCQDCPGQPDDGAFRGARVRCGVNGPEEEPVPGTSTPPAEPAAGGRGRRRRRAGRQMGPLPPSSSTQAFVFFLKKKLKR